MSEAFIIDGKEQARLLKTKLAIEIQLLQKTHRVAPGLAVLMVGEHPASEVYVRNKVKACDEVGILSFHHHLPESTSEKQLLAKIDSLNKDPKVHGILVQLPLPPQIDALTILDAINPLKDVDGFHPDNMGRLVNNQHDGLTPCTPMGAMLLLRSIAGTILRSSFEGYRAVVVGRSNIVGKPMSMLLLHADCTVTILHSKSQNMLEDIGKADIVVAAMGRPNAIKGEWLKPGSVVIDVGINRINLADGTTRLVGDVDYASASKVAAAITPVPGGVGPMTIACLLQNTVKALCLQRNLPLPGTH